MHYLTKENFDTDVNVLNHFNQFTFSFFSLFLCSQRLLIHLFVCLFSFFFLNAISIYLFHFRCRPHLIFIKKKKKSKRAMCHLPLIMHAGALKHGNDIACFIMIKTYFGSIRYRVMQDSYLI